MNPRNRPAPRGFTLIELAIVILIIGIILGFILVVSFAGIEQARIRSTQALITKLELGLNDRLNALLSISVTPNGGHRYIAAVEPPIPAPDPGVTASMIWGLPSDQRAQIIARIDQIKREIPDVFFIQPNPDYPVNFAGAGYGPAVNGFPYAQWELPVGHRHPLFRPADPPVYTGSGPTDNGVGDLNPGYPEGIFGASASARAALYQMMGLLPEGCDGVDNNGNGLIDEIAEGTGGDPVATANLQRFLDNHRHNTARSEILYALLVGGQGPLGPVFNADDFTSDEVRDTDGDGLPEFVDAWGRPLQFFRWPIYFASDGIQKGSAPYFGAIDPRETFPLDPSNTLMAPAWWGASVGSSANPSNKVALFQSLFTSLVDPNWTSGTMPQPTAWDRGGAYGRRAFYCRFLILSGGADQETGLNLLTDAEIAALIGSGGADAVSQAILTGAGTFPTNYRPAENFAAWNNWNPGAAPYPPEEAQDNIDNLGIQYQAGGTR